MNKKRKLYTSCPNCGHQLHDEPFCSQCGQQNHDLRVPFKHLLGELLESTLHLNSKSFKTIVALLLKPGFLTMQFNAGKRRSYVPPLRLYILLSFIFFFILAVRPKEASKNESSNQWEFTFYSIPSPKFTGLSDKEVDSLLVASDIDTTAFNKYMARQVRRMMNNPTEFRNALGKNISYMMFALMPLSAFFIFLLHKKSTRYYLDCLIFSIHYHSLLFILLILFIIVNMITDAGIISIVVLIYSLAYLFLSLKKVYSQNLFRAFYKTVILALLAPISIAVTFIVTIIISVMLY
jgi:hypothetical protein